MLAVMIRSLVAFLIFVLLTASAAAQDILMGAVTHVRNGDTIEVVGVPVRLNGVAAPELGEPHGREAKNFMLNLVAGKTVRCKLNGGRSYARVIGVCYVGGQDIGASIIAAGLARDCHWFSKGRYNSFNTAASLQLPLPSYCIRR